MGVKKSVDDSRLGFAIRNTKRIWKENRVVIIIALMVSYILGHAAIGLLTTYWEKLNHEIREITFGTVVGNGFSHFLLTLAAMVVIFVMIIRVLAKFNYDVHYDSQRGYHESANKEIGTATRMKDGPEKERTYTSSYAFETKELIYGRDIDHPEYLLTKNRSHRGLNDNIIVVGPPGCGKTRCWVIPQLFQMIRKGESVICTDTKASIYGLVWWVAKLHGYKTCFLNLDPKSIAHSDSVNLFTPAVKNDVACINFAESVVANLGSERETGYWPKAEKNLLTAVMLLVKNDPLRVEKSLSAVARILNNSTVESLISEFNTMYIEGSMMSACANNWMNSSERARADALSGLAMDFTKLLNPVIGKVVGTDGIELTAPGKEKCLYFVNLSDRDRSLDFLTALFFEEIISELSDMADNNSNGSGTLDVPTTLLFEEFANIGKIPKWETKMATLRSRLIQPIMILQSQGQLETVYGESEADTIWNACAIKIYLGTESEQTATYFRNRAGVTEIVVKNSRGAGASSVADPLKLEDEEVTTYMRKERYVYNLDEIYRIEHPRMLAFVAQHNVCEMERLDMSNHPMMAEVRKIKALNHYPEWVRKLDPREYDLYEIKEDIEAGKFRTEEQMLEDAGYTDRDRPYKCTEEDFEYFYEDTQPEKHTVTNNSDDEREIMEAVEEVDRIRSREGYISINEMKERKLTDIFK